MTDFRGYLRRCKDARSSVSRLYSGLPGDFSLSDDCQCLIFLSAREGGKKELYFKGLEGQSAPKKLQMAVKQRQLSRSEQLLRERMRVRGYGITGYEYLEARDAVFVRSGSACSVVDRTQASQGSSVVTDFPVPAGSVGHQLCPQVPDLLACVHNGDVWLCSASSGACQPLTDTAVDRSSRHLSAGQPSFVIQEEFDRYTGFWWKPSSGKQGASSLPETLSILYEEVDENKVELMTTFDPSSQSVEEYRYPVAGSTNATSRLRLLLLSPSPSSSQVTSVTLDLPGSLSELITDCEYLARAGWTPDGSRVWVVVVDRSQRHLQLVLLDIASFQPREGSLTTPPSSAPPPTPPFVLWEEKSDHWVNVTDHLQFLPPTPSLPLRLLLSSSRTGFCHLYLLEGSGPGAMATRQITAGQWSILGSKVWLGQELVWFEANISSPKDRHLYVTQLRSSTPCTDPVQVTEAGYYHTVTCFPDAGLFVDVYTSPSQPPAVGLCRVSFTSTQPLQLFSQPLLSLHPAPKPAYDLPPPHHFSFPSDSGELLYGAVFPPAGLVAGHKYPTVLYVYGGPQIQLVTNNFCPWLMRVDVWRRSGLAVVAVDNRGSGNRGAQFEAHIQGHMGYVEIRDQVCGLRQAADQLEFLDLQRVAIVGWSYGGYMALMGLAREPDVFKVAVAGAPVTDWMFYDTGYTERYLGLPSAAARAYTQSSVLEMVPQLPSESGRLLILHGLDDENVFFTHTSHLLQKMVACEKPYSLQVYVGERHGLRSASSAVHCDATVLDFLLHNL